MPEPRDACRSSRAPSARERPPCPRFPCASSFAAAGPAARYDYASSAGYNRSSQWCWACDDAARCDVTLRKLVLESSATVRYRWWKWRYQPAVAQLAREFPDVYTEARADQNATRARNVARE